MPERIYKQIPKQRRPQEHYEQPFPVPELPAFNDEVFNKVLESIDEATECAE